MAYALLTYEARLCSGCGDDTAETTKPENEENYEPEPPLLCHKCVARELAAKQFESHSHAGALLMRIRRKLERT